MGYWDRKHEIAVKELDAISWAAKKAGLSYGTFVSGMKPEQYREIMEAFCAELLRWKKEERARLMALSAAILVALSTNTGVKAAATARPSFSDVTQSQSYYADIESLAEQGWLS